MKYRVGLLTDKQLTHKDFNTKEEADNWLLSFIDKEEIIRYRIKDMETGDIIETEQGRRDKNEV